MLTTDVPDVEEPPGGPSRRVAVLYNNDFERADDSPSRADQEACQDVVEVAAHVGAALATAGFEPVLVPVASSLDDLVLRLRDMGAAAVFNLVESLGGDAAREPEVPALLASASIPFTGNRAATLLSAQDKHITRRLLSAWRVPIAAGVTVTDPDCIPSLQRAGLSFPVFIKPARQDASVGIDQGSIAYDMPQLCARLTHLAATVPGPWLVEDYLPGREFNVAFFPSPHGQPCLSEVDFSGLGAGLAPIVTYNCKWVPGTPDYDVCSRPCDLTIPATIQRAIEATARAALLAVGATGYGRVDLRLDARGLPRVIDVNPNPDLHPEAGFSLSAGFAGFSYPHVIHAILHHALRGSAHALLPSASRAPTRRPRTTRRDAPTYASVHIG
jgi:D-alanine-D-alanine ligase